MELVVFDRQPELVAHEVDVALDGLGRDFQLVGQLPTTSERNSAAIRNVWSVGVNARIRPIGDLPKRLHSAEASQRLKGYD